MSDVRTLLNQAQRRLALAGVEGPLRDARLLLQAAGDIPIATQIAFPERIVGQDAIALFETFVARRADRQPVAHILGRREFWSLDFVVTPSTLVPRPDSETLVQAVLERTLDRKARLSLLDFGTGTGCLLLALLHELPNATGLGIDISPDALDVAIENAAANGRQRSRRTNQQSVGLLAECVALNDLKLEEAADDDCAGDEGKDEQKSQAAVEHGGQVPSVEGVAVPDQIVAVGRGTRTARPRPGFRAGIAR